MKKLYLSRFNQELPMALEYYKLHNYSCPIALVSSEEILANNKYNLSAVFD
jgi:hypothetical protein